jgi:hypothetical protein
MGLLARWVLVVTLALAGPGFAQTATDDEHVGKIPQSAPGTAWSFIGFGFTTPADPAWFVATGTPRSAAMGRSLATADHTAVLAITSELLEQPVESDTALLTVARDRHSRIGERLTIAAHEETLVRHAGTRCARHRISGREPEVRGPRKDAAKAQAQRSYVSVIGIACIHPTEPRLLIELGVSERSPREGLTPAVQRDAEAAMQSLGFQRYSEQALQKSAELARSGQVQDAEAMLKPFVDADAAWARFFFAQIVQRAVPPPPGAASRMKALLEPAAERGLADAQRMLGTLLLRGAADVPADRALAEALLRRSAERGNPGAAYQLGLALLSGKDGVPPDQREAVLWIARAAARGQKEAQELLASARPGPAAAQPPARK